jgi:hypothetical protein
MMGSLRRQQAQEPRGDVKEGGHGVRTLSSARLFFQVTSPRDGPNIAPCLGM